MPGMRVDQGGEGADDAAPHPFPQIDGCRAGRARHRGACRSRAAGAGAGRGDLAAGAGASHQAAGIARASRQERRERRPAVSRGSPKDALRREEASLDLRHRLARRRQGVARGRHRVRAASGAAGRAELMDGVLPWQAWAVLSAVFAALTAIFAKIGIENINSDFATFIRTLVIIGCLAAFLAATGQFQSLGTVSTRTYAFLVLSGLATGASWVCYFRALKLGNASQVAPIDKLSVVLVAVFAVLFLGERPSLPNWLGIVLIAAGAVLVGWKR